MEVLGPSVLKAIKLRTNDDAWKLLLTEKISKEGVILHISKDGALTLSTSTKRQINEAKK